MNCNKNNESSATVTQNPKVCHNQNYVAITCFRLSQRNLSQLTIFASDTHFSPHEPTRCICSWTPPVERQSLPLKKWMNSETLKPTSTCDNWKALSNCRQGAANTRTKISFANTIDHAFYNTRKFRVNESWNPSCIMHTCQPSTILRLTERISSRALE